VEVCPCTTKAIELCRTPSAAARWPTGWTRSCAATRFNDDDKAFIESLGFFFLATADGGGQPDCSFKGGPPGFVSIAAPDLLVWPDYDGNGMFKSLGNIRANPNVGLLFLAMGEAPKRLRVNGRAEVVDDDPLMAAVPGAQLLVKVTPVDIFPNCPRYVPNMQLVEPSIYLPEPAAARSSRSGRPSRSSPTWSRRGGARLPSREAGEGDRSPSGAKSEWWRGRGSSAELAALPSHHRLFPRPSPGSADGPPFHCMGREKQRPPPSPAGALDRRFASGARRARRSAGRCRTRPA